MRTLDTRDLYKRQNELEDLKGNLETARQELAAFDPDRPDVAPDDEEWYERKAELEGAVELAEVYFGDEEREELAEIEEIAGYCSDFQHGEVMIPTRDFEEYAEELASEIGAIDHNASWPLSHIDWKAAAEELAQDYTEVEYQGTSYYVRS